MEKAVKYIYIDPEEEEVSLFTTKTNFSACKTETDHPLEVDVEKNISVDESMEKLREKLSQELVVNSPCRFKPMIMFSHLTPITDDSYGSMEENVLAQVGDVSLFMDTTTDIETRLMSLSHGRRLNGSFFDNMPDPEVSPDLPVNEPEPEVQQLLRTPKSIVKADKDGGYLSTLSEIAIIQAESVEKNDLNSTTSSYWSCATPGSKFFTPNLPFKQIKVDANKLSKSEFKQPAERMVLSSNRKTASVSKIPVPIGKGSAKKAVKSLRFSSDDLKTPKIKNIPTLKPNSGMRKTSLVKKNDENRAPIKRKL